MTQIDFIGELEERHHTLRGGLTSNGVYRLSNLASCRSFSLVEACCEHGAVV